MEFSIGLPESFTGGATQCFEGTQTSVSFGKWRNGEQQGCWVAFYYQFRAFSYTIRLQGGDEVCAQAKECKTETEYEGLFWRTVARCLLAEPSLLLELIDDVLRAGQEQGVRDIQRKMKEVLGIRP